MTIKLIMALLVAQRFFTVACGDKINRELPKVDPKSEQLPDSKFAPEFPKEMEGKEGKGKNKKK